MSKSKIEAWLEQKLRILHKKAFIPVAYCFIGSIIIGIIVRATGPHVPLNDLPTLNYVIVKSCLFGMIILGPVGYMLAIVGLKKDWVEKPQWFKDNFNL